MVFSSLPPNWHQQQNHQTSSGSGGISTSNTNNNNPQPEHNVVVVPPPPPVPVQPHHGGSIRPGSMADRARMADIPMPETALNCPRCDSTNTKFCYFNNYSLTQPRHFCKTCRRYWTRGGALRNVPVGGGCRRNKRSSSSSKAANKASPGPTSSAEVLPGLRFMAAPPLHHPALFTGGDMGLNYGPAADLGFHMAPCQFPFLPPDFDGATTSTGITHQMASVKMEDHNQMAAGIRHLLGTDHHHQYYWNNINASTSTTAWTDLSGFSSSSTTSNQL